MNKYLELMETIKQYLEFPDVESDTEIISAYDLIKIMESDLQELREMIRNNDFKNEINKKLFPFYNILKPLLQYFFPNSTYVVESIYYRTYDNIAIIEIQYNNRYNTHFNHLEINKNFNSEHPYYKNFEEKRDNRLLLEFLKQIIQRMNVLEKYSLRYKASISPDGLYLDELSSFYGQEFSDDFLILSIKLKDLKFKTSIKVSKKFDPENICDRNWGNRIKINDFISENYNTLLRKIPIYVRDLNPIVVSIIKEKLSEDSLNTLVREKHI